MSLSRNRTAFFLGAALLVAVSASANAAGDSVHCLADGLRTASHHPAPIVVAEAGIGSWFWPLFIHQWPSFTNTAIG